MSKSICAYVNNGMYTTYNTALMNTPLDKTKIPLSAIFDLESNRWTVRCYTSTSNKCRYHHTWKVTYYPYDHSIYNENYQIDNNYFIMYKSKLSEKSLKECKGINLINAIEKIEQTIVKLKVKRDHYLHLQKFKQIIDQEKKITTVKKRQRFHMFRDQYLKQHGKNLTSRQASQLWEKLTEDEKEYFNQLAENEYQNKIQKAKESKIYSDI